MTVFPRFRRAVYLSLSGLVLALPLSAETAIRAVTLSTAGLAMIEAEGALGTDPLRFSVLRDDVDDVLKSLWVIDPAGGVPMLTLTGPGSFEDGFAHLPFGPQDLADRGRLLQAMVGAPVALQRRGENWTGTLMGVSERPCENGPCSTLTVMADDGRMLSFDLDTALEVTFTDQADAAQVAAGLRAWRAGANPRRVELALTSSDAAARDVGLIYLQRAPLWRTAWRAVDRGGELALTGWAVVENTTGMDWQDVSLTLATGQVRAIDADLYQRTYVGREPDIPAPAPMVMAGFARESARSFEMVADQAVVEITADDGTSFSRFTLGTPVTLPAGQMMSVPFLSETLPQSVIRLVRGGTGARHPSLALVIENPLPLRLPAGVVTIYEDGRGHAGDAQIPELAPGAEETVVYAQDTAVDLREDTGQTQTLRQMRLTNGVLIVTEDLERTTTYRLVGADQGDRVITLDHPRNPGWTVTAATGPEERTDAWRWQIDVPQGETVSFELRERQPQQRRFALMDMDTQTLAAWQSRSTDPQVTETLRRFAELRTQISAAEGRQRQLAAQVQGLEREQQRLVNLIVQLGDDSQANRDRRARVDDIDAEITQAQANIRAAVEEVEALRQQIAALIGQG